MAYTIRLSDCIYKPAAFISTKADGPSPKWTEKTA
jgi:hypothetical protein